MTGTTTAPPGPLPAALDVSPARRRVFEGALELFGQRGYHAVSVRDIASSLGLKPMALYAHVASKQDLLLELVRIGFATHRDRLAVALLECGSDPVDQIRALVEAHVRVHLDHPALARVVDREVESLEQVHAPELARLRADAGRAFRDVVLRGQRLGVFVGEDPALLLHAVASMGVRAYESRSPHLGPEQVAQGLARLAVRMLTADGPGDSGL